MSDFDINAAANRMFPSSVPVPTAAQPAAPESTGGWLQQAMREQRGDTSAATAQPADKPATTQPEATATAEKPQEAAQDSESQQDPPSNPELPDAIRELRNDPLRRMFSPQGTFASVPLEDAFANVAVDPEAKAAAAAEYREIFEDIGASPQDAHELVTAARAFSAEPITPERDSSNWNAAIDALNRHYGKDANAALEAAQAMINRDPRLAHMLDRTRLGNDPRTVLKVVALARSYRR